MRKFYDVYKEKQTKSEQLFEGKVLNEFKGVYKALLEKYHIVDFYTLNEEEQITFLAEMNSFWTKEEGLSEKGAKFMRIRSDVLSESSTPLQKKNFLKNKATTIINETLRQSEIKFKIYDIIDEMYNEIKASQLSDILSPDMISNIIRESFNGTIDKFLTEITTELNESSKKVSKK